MILTVSVLFPGLGEITIVAALIGGVMIAAIAAPKFVQRGPRSAHKVKVSIATIKQLKRARGLADATA